MLELEAQIRDTLPTPAKQRRYTFLVNARAHYARLASILTCLTGSVENLSLDHQIVLHEQAIGDLIPDPAAAAVLAVEWIVNDAALIHVRGYPPAHFDCPVCTSDGQFNVSDLVDLIPDDLNL